MTFTLVDPERRGSVAEALGAGGVAGPVVAHLTGSSALMRGVADELRSRSVPYLHSPMLPSIPSRLASLLGRSGPGAATAAHALAIGAGAANVIIGEARSAGFLRARGGIPEERIETLRPPAVGEGLLSGRASGSGNLALAFCDAMTPEWNVMRFLFAMEKINADGVVVAGGADGAFARECEARAALNPRVSVFRYGAGRPPSLSDDIAGFVRRATVVVDPSLRALGGAAVAALAEQGVPGVVSAESVHLATAAPGLHPFEPSSWELLNHAITSAFNAAAAAASDARKTAAVGAAGPAPSGSPENINAETARCLERLYRRAAAG